MPHEVELPYPLRHEPVEHLRLRAFCTASCASMPEINSKRIMFSVVNVHELPTCGIRNLQQSRDHVPEIAERFRALPLVIPASESEHTMPQRHHHFAEAVDLSLRLDRVLIRARDRNRSRRVHHVSAEEYESVRLREYPIAELDYARDLAREMPVLDIREHD